MLGPPAGRPGTSTCPNPQRVGVSNLTVADARRRHFSDLDEKRRGTRRKRRRIRTTARRNRVERRTLFTRVKRSDHREDDLAVLDRAHVPRRERTSVAVAVDVEDHGPVDPPGPEEVAVQRVRQPVGRHRSAGGPQRLRRDLAAVQRHARARALLVLPAEQVAVEHLEVEQGREAVGRRIFGVRLHAYSRPVTSPGLRTIISVTPAAEVEAKEEPCCSPA